MPGNLNFAPNARDLSVGTDQEGCTIDAHVFAAVHAFFDPGAVGLADRAVLVRREREGTIVLLLEPVVSFHAVARYADYFRTDLREVGQGVGEAAGFLGASGDRKGVRSGKSVYGRGVSGGGRINK